MAMTQEERKRLADRLVERRQNASEAVEASAAERLESAVKRDKVRHGVKPKSGPSAYRIDEQKELEAYLASVQLRQVDGDGIKPPVLVCVQRTLQREVNGQSGLVGPKNEALIEARIHVLMVLQYQEKLTQRGAGERMGELFKYVQAAKAVLASFRAYAVESERAYAPYLQNRWSYGAARVELAKGGIAMCDDNHEADELTFLYERRWMKCLADETHRTWKISLADAFHGGLNSCPICRRIRKGYTKVDLAK